MFWAGDDTEYGRESFAMNNRKRREMLVLQRDSLLNMMRDREQVTLRALSHGRIEPTHNETIRALAALALAELEIAAIDAKVEG